jgi:hypothetical protein
MNLTFIPLSADEKIAGRSCSGCWGKGCC